MKPQRFLSLLYILLLAVALAGCGDEEPTPTATPAAALVVATDTPVPPTNTPLLPTSTPGAPATNTPLPAVRATNNFQAPSAVLKSYRTQGQFLITTTFPDGTTDMQEMNLEGAFVKADNSYGSNESFRMLIQEQSGEDSFEIYKIGEWASVNSEGEWITLGRDNAGLFTAMPDIFGGFVDQFVQGQADAQNLGDEDVEGVAATHYQIEDVAIFRQIAQIGPDSEEVIEQVGMDVWVAKEGNYILKYSVQAEASNVKQTDSSGAEVLASQNVNWQYLVYDVNQDFTISLPADAPEPGAISIPGFAEGEFPLPEGAKLTANQIGMPQVTGELSQAELTKFYTDAFAAAGWSFTGDFGFYQVSKGEVNFTMFIDTDEAGKGRAQVFVE